MTTTLDDVSAITEDFPLMDRRTRTTGNPARTFLSNEEEEEEEVTRWQHNGDGSEDDFTDERRGNGLIRRSEYGRGRRTYI
ncbi:hypothetical protein MRB53_013968 [Persea americana]|uniref:Uncharacterized protein n=1 Tax=Persea americana TaxID=3435 RepID=A0ACC2K9W9_PERAE|nr:hypothetical protein MRB53_013968 [Persea americana]